MSDKRPTAQRPHESSEDAAKLIAAVGVAIFERSRQGEFTLVSPAPQWLRELVPGVATGAAVAMVEAFPAIDAFLPEAEPVWQGGAPAEAVSDLWTETQASGQEVHLRARALNADERQWLLVERANSLYRERQLVLQYAHDLAIQNETILRLNREVERATQAKSDFLAMMSHEIRTPLHAILGMADLLAETQLSEEQQKYVETFQRAGSNLLTLVNDLLDLSKIEAGNLALESENFDLLDVVGRAIELVRLKGLEKKISVSYEIATGTPRYLRGDGFRLRQALLNLLGNSLKFTEQGSVRLTVEPEADAGERLRLRFTVRDTGIGIAKDQLEKVFQRFSQADSSITRKYGGTGLGLAITKKLVEAMSGRIWVESTLGEGSRFFFTACFEAGEAPELAQTEGEGSAGFTPNIVVPQIAPHTVSPHSRAPDIAPDSIASWRILVADDSEDNRFLIRSYLKSQPYELDFAENGVIAFEKLKTGDYDLALVDVHMPEMDGYAVARNVRDLERNRGDHALPLLALTADGYAAAIERSAAAGFSAHLTKPLRKQTLLEAIAKHARVRQRAATAGNKDKSDSWASLVGRYLENARRKAAEIAAAIESEDFDAIRSAGHNMKGTGTAYGFPRLTELGARIEQAARQRDGNALRGAASDLMTYLDQVTTSLTPAE